MAGSVYSHGSINPADLHPDDLYNHPEDDPSAHHGHGHRPMPGAFPETHLNAEGGGNGGGGFLDRIANRFGLGGGTNSPGNNPTGNTAPSKLNGGRSMASALLNAYKVAKPIVEGVVASKKAGQPISGRALLEAIPKEELGKFFHQFKDGVKEYMDKKKIDDMDPANQLEKNIKETKRMGRLQVALERIKSWMNMRLSGAQTIAQMSRIGLH